MEKVYLQWTIENWITVFLMVALGYAALGILMSVLGKKSAPAAET